MADKDLKSLTLGDTTMTIPRVGDVYVDSASVKPTAVNAWVKGGSINLPKGNYIVTVCANIGMASSTAARVLITQMCKNSNEWIGGNTYSGINTDVSMMFSNAIELTEDSEVYVRYSASTLPTTAKTAWIRAIRVGGVIRHLKNLANSICYRPLNFGKAVA